MFDMLAPLCQKLLSFYAQDMDQPQLSVSSVACLAMEVDLLLAIRRMERAIKTCSAPESDQRQVEQCIVQLSQLVNSYTRLLGGVFLRERKSTLIDATLILYETLNSYKLERSSSDAAPETLSRPGKALVRDFELEALACIYNVLVSADYSDIFLLTTVGIQLGLLYEDKEMYKEAVKV